jgi:RNA polymerase sigma-70 factor, ECF subfamily
MADLSQIVQEHAPIVWRTVYRLLNNEADGADCFQQTFLAAFELARKQEIRNWPGLLTRLAAARALDRRRQRGRDLLQMTEPPEESLVDSREDAPGQAAETAELSEQLRDALAALDSRQAHIFCLACLEGFSYEQIAEQLDITANHVGVLLNRARLSLREQLRAFKPAHMPSGSNERASHD